MTWEIDFSIISFSTLVNFLSYKIKNSYSQDKLEFKEKVYYNKKKYMVSGYGLEIVNDIAEKYDGYIEIDKDEEEYSLSIVLNLSEKGSVI